MNANKEVEWRRFIVPKKVEQINDYTAEQKKLCLYTGSSFPIRYINFKINFNFNESKCF